MFAIYCFSVGQVRRKAELADRRKVALEERAADNIAAGDIVCALQPSKWVR
jgi:hypothetical protein